MTEKISLAVIATHPIQYQVPIYRALAADQEVKVHVFFASDHSLRGAVDPGFGVSVAWDVPLLQGYEYTFLKNGWHSKNLNSFWAFNCPGLFQELSPVKFDAVLIIAYTPLYYLQALIAAKRAGIPILLRIEATDVAVWRSSGKSLLRKILLTWIYRQVVICLPIGHNARRHYLAHGVPDGRMEFSPYCVDNTLFQAQAAQWLPLRNEIRRELGFGPDTFVVIFSGKLIPKKDPFTLIRAIGMVKAPVGLIFMGDGELRHRAEQMCRDKLRHQFAFVGFQNQSCLGRYYAAADALVLPSVSGETWGLVVNEAMNFGLPVIVSDRVGCSPDLVKPGETGYIFPRGDAKVLAHCLEELASSPEKTRRMGEATRQLVSRYGVEQAASGIKKAFIRAATHDV